MSAPEYRVGYGYDGDYMQVESHVMDPDGNLVENRFSDYREALACAKAEHLAELEFRRSELRDRSGDVPSSWVLSGGEPVAEVSGWRSKVEEWI